MEIDNDLTIVSPNDTHWITKILIDDPILVENRERFYFSLGLPVGKLLALRTETILHGSGSYGFFVCTINEWISLNGSNATFDSLLSTLREETFLATAEKISNIWKTRSIVSTVSLVDSSNNDTNWKEMRRVENYTWFDVPDKIKWFTGREIELNLLHERVMSETETAVITTVSGMGGIGKTTLAIKYVWEYHNYFSSNVIWVNAESVDSMSDSFIRLAKKLDLDISDTNSGLNYELKKISSLVYKVFQRSKSLFVFDNAESFDEIRPCLPGNADLHNISQYVLITSRNKRWNDNFRTIELNIFTEEESLEFLKNYLKLETREELDLAKELSNVLQNLPIAVRQAAAFIKTQMETSLLPKNECKIHLRDYLVQFEKNSQELLTFEYWRKTGETTGEKTTFVTWNLSLDKIKKQNKLSIRIMDLISYLNPDNIPPEIFKVYLDNKRRRYFRRNLDPVTSESNLTDAINLLVQYSIVVVNNGLLSVHRLVQRVIRHQNQASATKLIKSGLKILENFYGWRYSQHLQSIWRHALKYDKLVKEFPHMVMEACKFIEFNENIVEEAQLIETTITKLKIIFPTNPKYVIQIQCNEIRSMSRSNRLNPNMILEVSHILYENCKNFKFAVTGLFSFYHTEHVGNTLFRVGKRSVQFRNRLFESALKFYYLFFDYVKQTRSLEYGDYFISQSSKNIIKCLSALGRVDEVIKIVEEIEELFIQHYSPHHPKTLNAQRKLAF